MRSLCVFAVIAVCLLTLTGCHPSQKPLPAGPVTMKAGFISEPIAVDGALNEAVWDKAITYQMYLPADQLSATGRLREGGQVQLAWDASYFYVGIRCTDSDLVAEGQEDGLRHFELGDLFELFLKPEHQSWYWELYVTPRGKKTDFFFPGCGRFGLPGAMDYQSGLKVAAQCQGTLDNWRDKDTGWTAEMAVPIKDLTAEGDAFGPGAKWRILVARYNYSRYFDAPRGPEYSMTPKLSQTNFHLLSEYAYLELVK